MDTYNKDFWQAIDKLIAESELVIDRLKGSHHPRYTILLQRDKVTAPELAKKFEVSRQE